ncbi:hypothetical protein NC651_014250 [Populus alba x Populus x berolinensis]|nr:hypothetical protein NC651_014250 [Populus alba x Populus x berolinensis]
MDSVEFLTYFITLNTLINCFCNVKRASDGLLVFGRVFRPNAVTFSSMIKGLCVDDKIGEAVGLFKKMVNKGRKRNVVSYNSLINGYCKNRKVDEAMRL